MVMRDKIPDLLQAVFVKGRSIDPFWLSNSSKKNVSLFADAIPETVGELFYNNFCK